MRRSGDGVGRLVDMILRREFQYDMVPRILERKTLSSFLRVNPFFGDFLVLSGIDFDLGPLNSVRARDGCMGRAVDSKLEP